MDPLDESQLLTEIRRTNLLLELALGEQIGGRIRDLVSGTAASRVVAVLGEQDQPTEEAQKRAARLGVSRSSFFRVLADLERSGIVKRQQRGRLSLDPLVAKYLPSKE